MSRAGARVSWIVALGGVLLAGCSRTPFGEEDPGSPKYRARSPYERYSVLRGEQRPAKEMDEFGLERPALRARLAPLDQP